MHPPRRWTQNFHLLWLDASMEQSHEHCQKQLTQLRHIVNDVNLFTQQDECIDFLTDVDDRKAFLLVEGEMGQRIMPLIHDIPQLDAIYFLCRNTTSFYEPWTKAWKKVKGVDAEITSICKRLQQTTKQCDESLITVSFLALNEATSTENLDRLDPSFMYTQMLKEILLEIEYSEKSVKKFTDYCRFGDYGSPITIDQFETGYHAELAIWWYTYPSFVYSLLNCALRLLNAGTIINMGFFIRDLNWQIEQLHQRQRSDYHDKPFVVYRGQALSATDFKKLCKSKGGLMSFNNFLSTSTDREVSLGYALAASTDEGKVGILFQISVDPSISAAPFATIREVSYFRTEEEILFSMHTVFRIADIKLMDSDNPFFEVDLHQTLDDDQQLRTLTELIRQETLDFTGWQRVGQLLLQIGQFNEAEELYSTLIEETTDEREKAHFYGQLGAAKDQQGEYEKSIWYYEKLIEICQRTLPPNHRSLAYSYNNMATVYSHKGDYSTALSFYEKTLEIDQKTLPPNRNDLATCYNNIGGVYYDMGAYSKAISVYERVVELCQEDLPLNRSSLGTTYNNMAAVYDSKGEYSTALSFYEKSIEIYEEILPPNHPDLATYYNNIGTTYCSMAVYSEALPFFEKALELCQKSLPPYHPVLAHSHNQIGAVYDNMGQYSEALSHSESALDIRQRSLPSHHPLIRKVKKQIKGIKKKMEST